MLERPIWWALLMMRLMYGMLIASAGYLTIILCLASGKVAQENYQVWIEAVWADVFLLFAAFMIINFEARTIRNLKERQGRIGRG